MEYSKALNYLTNSCKFGSKRGLDNFKKLLKLMDNPHENLKVIHVAGTNGKGSCCVMLASILKEQGYNVGLFISPHLIRYNERISINGQYISDEDFADIIGVVKDKAEMLFNNTNDFFSFFEIITAAAFLYFKKKSVDFVILETGMGGRLDSTNAVDNPIVSVITSISFDHTEYLGNTIEEIAFEKGGIIKKNLPTVLYCQDKKVYNKIKDICDAKNSSLFYVDEYNEKIISMNVEETVFSVKNKYADYNCIKLKMSGKYQVKNACNVLSVVYVLKKRGILIDDYAVLKGLEKASFAGRMEIIKRNPLFILDGAHNYDGINQMADFLGFIRNLGYNNIIALFGVLKDKDYLKMFEMLMEVCDKVILTKPVNLRAVSPIEIMKGLSYNKNNVFIEDNYKNAVKCALDMAELKGCVICVGSLYLVGDVKRYVKEVLM